MDHDLARRGAGKRSRTRGPDLRSWATRPGLGRPHRDLDEALRSRVLDRLDKLGADEETMLPVREFHELRSKAQGVALGDALPVGLRLVSEEDSDQS